MRLCTHVIAREAVSEWERNLNKGKREVVGMMEGVDGRFSSESGCIMVYEFM